MKALLLAAALALGSAAPLAAQEADPAAAENAAVEAEDLSGSGPILLVSGPDALLAQFGTAPLDRVASLCLEPGEEALLVSDRVTFQLTGGSCFIVSAAERTAFEAEQRVLAGEARALASAAYDAAIASGDQSAIDQAFEKLQAAAQNAPDDGWDVPETSTGDAEMASSVAAAQRERQAAIEELEREERQSGERRVAPARPSASAPRPSASRLRSAALRGMASPAVPPRPIIFRVANASPGVLDRFPRGTIVQRTTSLCLNNGEQATILGSNGQSVTYSGPGCLQRRLKPTGDNVGGFTFG